MEPTTSASIRVPSQGELTAEYLAQAKDNPCMDCNQKYDSVVMEFDHRDASSKIGNISHMRRWPLDLVIAEVGKCDLVCANCHRLRGVRRGYGKTNRRSSNPVLPRKESAMKLTDLSIRNLKAPSTGQRVYLDGTIPGFGVRMSQGGAGSFVLTFGKGRTRITLGRVGIISLKDAREQARKFLAQRTLGKYGALRVTYADALQLYLEEKKNKVRKATVDEDERILKKYFSTLMTKTVEDINTHQISDSLYVLRNTPGSALHAYAAIRTFMKWCVGRRYITHSPVEGLQAPAKMEARDRVLNDNELRAIWIACETESPISNIVRLLILTGQRRGEIGSLKGEWLDLERGICTIPKNSTKNGRTHPFPIGPLSVSILKEHGVVPGYLFPARGSNGERPFNGWSKAKSQLDAKVEQILGQPCEFTIHDIRRSLATNWQRLGLKYEIIESYLNHISGLRGGVAGIYQRHRYEEEMREAVLKYESWFITNIGGK